MKTEKVLIVILGMITLLAFAIAVHAQHKYEIKDTHGKLGLTCRDCHGDKSPQQVPEMTACLKCHKSYEAVAARTKNLKPNPHESHKGEIACADCHSTHGTSKLSCNDCHSFTNFKMK